MSQTLQYLQSESAEQGIEIGLLVNYLSDFGISGAGALRKFRPL